MNAFTRRRSAALGWTLLTGLTCTAACAAASAAPFSTTADPSSQAVDATGSGATVPPTAPSPEAPLDASKPADSTSTAAPPAAAAPSAPPTTGLPAISWRPWQSITSFLSPTAAAAETSPGPSNRATSRPAEKTRPTEPGVDGPKTEGRSTARIAARGAGTAAGTTSGSGASRAAKPPVAGGGFDPAINMAGLFVSDADDQTASQAASTDMDGGLVAPPAVLSPGLAWPGSEPEEDSEPEQSAVITDEEVSLVSWLSGYMTGSGSGGHGSPRICLADRCCPTWEAQVDALFLWQGNLPSRPLFTDSATGATALDANQLYGPAAIAPRYSLTYNRDQCRAIEVNYFQVWGFNGQELLGPQVDALGDGAFEQANLVNPSFNTVAGAHVTSSARIQSLEVNLRKTDGGMIQWISGFRWLEWGQQLNIDDAIVQGGALVGGDIIDVNTLNSLYGWQWGGDMMLWNAGRWLRVNAIGKAGVYYNHQAAQNTYYNDFFNPEANFAGADDTVSFVGETGINASFALTNWLSWRAGYTCFWLGGVATPDRQLGLTSVADGTTSINTNGSVFLHGVTTGLEARW